VADVAVEVAAVSHDGDEIGGGHVGGLGQGVQSLGG
jgi:hypothetical protein